MPSPSTSIATLRPDLAGCFTEFDLAMDRKGFIGQRVLPVFETAEASGSFGRIPIEELLKAADVDRAPGAEYSTGDWNFTTETFATQERGHQNPVDDNEAKIYRHYFDAEQITAQRVLDVVLREQEKRAAALIFDAATWTGAALTTGVTNEWDSNHKTDAVPINDVEGAVRYVWANSGIWPNALIINRTVFRNLRNIDQIVNRIESSGAGSPTKATDITAQMLAEVFDLDYVIVAGSAKNTAKEGQSVSIANVWSSEYAMVCRVAETNDIQEPCIGRIMHWDEDGSSPGGTVESYRNEGRRSDMIRVRHQVQEKRLYTQMGHLLSNVTAL